MLLNNLSDLCHEANKQWWTDIHTGKPLQRNKSELLMLAVSEIAEAMEGERKNLADDKLPHRSMAEVELADALIRVFDYAGAHKYDLDSGFYYRVIGLEYTDTLNGLGMALMPAITTTTWMAPWLRKWPLMLPEKTTSGSIAFRPTGRNGDDSRQLG